MYLGSEDDLISIEGLPDYSVYDDEAVDEEDAFGHTCIDS